MEPKDPRNISMAELQEMDYGASRDYVWGSPHLAHPSIRRSIEADLRGIVAGQIDRLGRCRVLEIGAGHGAFTSTLLDAGAKVTVTEMSLPSSQFLSRKYATHPDVNIVHDPGGNLSHEYAHACDLVVMISVLHHIPDYIGDVTALVNRLPDGGAFYCAQDPMWYPSRSRASLLRDKGSYMLWRLAQGNLRQGLATRARRLRGNLDEENPADMVEYHVVRDGVDEVSLNKVLSARFDDVSMRCYWSTQSAPLQRLGDALGWTSSFSITARPTVHHAAATEPD